jgi:hypothetical protein
MTMIRYFFEIMALTDVVLYGFKFLSLTITSDVQISDLHSFTLDQRQIVYWARFPISTLTSDRLFTGRDSLSLHLTSDRLVTWHDSLSNQ